MKKTPRTDYTREELIELCEAAIVPMEHWNDRDSARAQRQLGEAWAQLRAGCPFTVYPAKGQPGADDTLDTDDETIWIQIRSCGFNAFEYGDNRDEARGRPSGYGEPNSDNYDEDAAYIPTRKRLAERAGRDWY